MSRRKRRSAIEGQFAARLIEMMESPAFQALTLAGRRVLDRLEIEHANHGGTVNDRLPVTYGDFQRFGIDRQGIAPAIREVVALGFAEITERGRPSESDFGRHPNLFRLTYHITDDRGRTHEWRRHQSLAEAEEVRRLARDAKDEKSVAKAKARLRRKTAAGGGGTSLTGGKNQPVSAALPGGKNHPTVPGGSSNPTIYISGREDAA